MSDYLDSIILPSGSNPYSASYIKPSTSEKPSSGCNLPDATGSPISLPSLTSPGTSKACAPLFVEFPLVPAPFAVPENCPTGITFNASQFNIFAAAGDSSPAGQLPLSISRSGDNFCAFDLSLPDIIIPCFPAGPSVNGTANINVIDPNSGTNTISQIGVIQNSACSWSLDGNVTIELPLVPCPSGPVFVGSSLQIKSTCPSLSNYVDRKPITITKPSDNACAYQLNMPAITIPCYPNGPSVTGNINVNITDSGTATTAGTQTAGFNNPLDGCCEFNLGGDVNIDIPCSTTGVTIQLSDVNITDPFTGTVTALPVVTSPDSTFCSTLLDFPPISIPCYPDGIHLPIITFTGVTPSGGRTTPLTFVDLKHDSNVTGGLRDPDVGCLWHDPVVNLPFPVCPSGFNANVSALNVYINNSNRLPQTTPDNPHNLTRYNALTFTTDDNCGFNLAGSINLGLGAVATCSALDIGSNGFTINVGSGTSATPYKISMGPVAGSSCSYEFSGGPVEIPAVVCSGGTGLNPTQDKNGDPIAVTVVDGNNNVVPQTNGTPLKLAPYDSANPTCSFGLSGTITLPASSGTGVGASHWSINEPYTQGSSVSYVPPEGAICSYVASCSGGVNAGVPPGSATDATADCWQLQYASHPGPAFPPFTVIRCNENTTANTSMQNATSSSAATTQTYKVVPGSYLYQSTATISDRYYVFGLDTPFTIAPNQEVYLEVVFNRTSIYGAMSVAYAAVCVGDSRDIAVTVGGQTVAASTNNFKLISPKDSLVLTSTLGGSNDYFAASTAKIVGVNKGVAKDLQGLQANALHSIAQYSSSTDTTPYQFKAYITIAKAGAPLTVAASTSGATGVIPTTSDVGAGNSTSKISFAIKQILKSHLGLVADNFNKTPVARLIAYSGGATASTIASTAANSNGAFTPNLADAQNTLVFTYASGLGVSSSLLQQVITNIAGITSPSGFSATVLNNSYLGGGFQTPNVDSESIHIYYTLDGSMPTINTSQNKNSVRYDPAQTVIIDTTQNPVTVNWMAVFSEYGISGVSTMTLPKFVP